MTSLELGYGTARILEPDIDILPCTVADVPDIVDLAGGERREGALTGMRALLLALLEDSIRCYLGDKPKLRLAAERWIEGRQRGVAITFDAVCESFGLEPTAIRRGLRRLRHQNTVPRELGRARPNVRHNALLAMRRRRSKAKAA